MDFSETIEVKVVDKEDNFALDSYFFAYFHDLTGALDQIRDAVRNHRSQSGVSEDKSPALLDTTVSRSPLAPERSNIVESTASKATSGFRLSSIFRPFSDPPTPIKGTSTLAASELQSDDYTHVFRKPDSSSFVPLSTSPKPMANMLSRPHDELLESSTVRSTQSLPPLEHTYPPSPSNSSIYPDHSSLSRDNNNSSWTVGVPSWLKSSKRVFGGSSGIESPTTFISTPVKEVYFSAASSPGPVSRSSGNGDMAFSVLETPELLLDQDTADKFRSAFAYDEKETLLGCKLFGAVP
jgi:sterol 3beta-glucosyltransferase